MLAIDIAAAALIAGIVVLCVTTTITTLALPSFLPSWRRRRQPPPPMIPVTYRRALAEPPARPAIELPPAPRHRGAWLDDRVAQGDVDAAWALIERMLEHEPDRLVDILTRWISSDEADAPTHQTDETDRSPEEGPTP